MSQDRKPTMFAAAVGENPEDAKRHAEIAFLLNRFERTGDTQTLIRLINLDPPGGDAGVAKALVAKLEQERENKKAANYQIYMEINRLFTFLREQGHSVEYSYTKIAEIYFPDEEGKEPKPIDSIRKQHQRWLERAGQNF